MNIERIRNLLAKRKKGHALEHAFYTDPEVFDFDLETIFYRDWLFIAPTCEIPNPGDYITHRVGAYRLIIVRGTDGKIRSFHNSCRHRGSIICKNSKGQAKRFVCPYHQWTYDLDGRLLGVRDANPNFDLSLYGLKPVHCRDLAGLIYICIADEPPDFEPFADSITPFLTVHDLADAKIAHQSRIVENGNWKLVWENNRECYHCMVSHPSLLRTFPEDPAISFVGNNTAPPYIEEHWKACESHGVPARYHASSDGQYRISRMPLVEGAKSFTMDGDFAVQQPKLGHIPLDTAGVFNKFHYPSTWDYFLPDHSLLFRVTPISPTETELVTTWLVHKDAVEGVDYDFDRLTEVWIATNDEDRRLVEDNQEGVNSPAYEPGPYNELHEASVAGFVDWYCKVTSERIAATSNA